MDLKMAAFFAIGFLVVAAAISGLALHFDKDPDTQVDPLPWRAIVPATNTAPAAPPADDAGSEHDQLVASYKRLGRKGRAEQMRATCKSGIYVEDEVLQAADTGDEIAELRNGCQLLMNTADTDRAAALRRNFAAEYDTALLARHMNPDSVTANGTTLHVEGWFCTRQFMFDFSRGGDSARAKAVGFTRIECASAAESYSQQM
jgi:hypothetical protein